ncbi:M20 family metallopeptidase [Candidatus Bipolaricaulota bacterium]|nr:M20 family metallopeptidase [Candidatus Bipolaricaulota bacterium]
MSVKQQATKHIELLSDDLHNLASRIHNNPELGSEEHKAVEQINSFLKDSQFEFGCGIDGMETAFQATHYQRSPGPTVALLAEYDALPSLGHACGHNLIAAASVGAAIGVGKIKENLPGKLVLLGTPGEENIGGKINMVTEGVFDEIDAAMMFHPSDQNVVGKSSLSCSSLEIIFHGASAHASGSPEEGINALDATIQTFNSLNALRQHIEDDSRIHGIITNGGEKPNIVPELASCEFNIRAPEDEYKDDLVEKLKKCAKGAALATGCEVEFNQPEPSYKAMRPNEPLVKAFKKNGESLGLEFQQAEGGAGSTDMGDVSQTIPAIHPYLSIVPEGTSAHTSEFRDAADSKKGKEVMITAAKILAMTAIDVLTKGSLNTEMKEYFAETAP